MEGLFWCVESNGWLRFNTENGFAEIAAIDQNHPSITTPWQRIDEGIFHIYLKDENKHEYYCLKDQMFYRLDGENTLTGLKAVSKYSNSTWSRENKSRVFDGLIKSTTAPDVDFKYPLTPQQQEALKKVKAMFANENWRAIQANDNLPIIIARTINNGLSEDQNTDLTHLLNNYFIATGFSAKNYDTHEEYLAALHDIIIYHENIHHEGLVNLAARTVDPIPSLEELGDAQAINQLKKYFFFEFLNEMYNYIRKQFGLAEEQLTTLVATPPIQPASPVPFLPNIIIPAGQDIAQDELVLPSPIAHDNKFIRESLDEAIESTIGKEDRQILIQQLADALQDILSSKFATLEDYITNLREVVGDTNNDYHQIINALSYDESGCFNVTKYDFFFSVLYLEISQANSPIIENVTQDVVLQPETVTPTKDLRLEKGDGGDNLAPLKTLDKMAISSAMNQALTNYQNWYNGQKPSPRGENGFFSWLRHGSYGQARATALNDAVSHCGNADDAIAKINEFLTDGKTRYHRHSFASFMLDELSAIKDSPWDSVKFIDSSNKYDPSSLNGPKIPKVLGVGA